jgi:hypothetical protein
MSRASFSFLKVLLFVALIVGIERFCHKQTEGFRLHKIASTLPFNPNWEVTSLSPEETAQVDAILDQRFFFLASGGQSYAFVSEDGQTILKVFKQHHLRTWKWLKSFPLPQALHHYRRKFVRKREQKLPFFFTSCKIAFEDFKDRTGLLYLHLNKTAHLKKQLTIVDKLGIAYSIDLDSTEFALQKKAELAYPKLERLAKAGQLDTAKECLNSLLELILERSKRGISDRDPNIRRNIGFIGNHAVEVDLGSFSKDPFLMRTYAYKAELYYQTLGLKDWVKEHFFSLYPYLNERIEFLLQQEK